MSPPADCRRDSRTPKLMGTRTMWGAEVREFPARTGLSRRDCPGDSRPMVMDRTSPQSGLAYSLPVGPESYPPQTTGVPGY